MSRQILLAAATLAMLSGGVAGNAAEPPPSASSPAPAASAPEHPSAPPPQVTIEGRRAALEPRISAYVQLVAGSYYSEDLSRWRRDACPLVSGVPSQEGEFILGRLSEIARAAGVPLAGEKCAPNLYIMVTAHPQELLKAMDAQNHEFTFGKAPVELINQFISASKPVRVWYHTGEETPEGTPLMSVAFPNIETVNGQPLIDTSSTGARGGGTNTWAQATRVSSNFISEIYRAFVIVDASQLHGTTRGQIADYVAMVGFAEIKSVTQTTDAPTILKLFEGTPQTAPAGATDWDQAYLKSLYVTEQKSKVQRSLIAREMLREIVH